MIQVILYMAGVVVLYSDSSSDSVKEIEPPKKLPPPLIELDTDEIILNVNNKATGRVLVENIYKNYEIPMESANDNPGHWTSDMIKFYNDDWGDEDQFIVEKLQEGMDKHPSLWGVSPKDLLFTKNKKNRSYLKCWNCCQYGHNANQCREPIHIPKCHMCGEPGHVEKSCPNSICLNCGNQMNSFVLWCRKCESESEKQCSRCSLHGHHFLNCSDNWRRFHSTTGKVDVDIPQKEMYKSTNEMWCCNCGRKGHIQIDCHARKEMCFPETLPFVASYETAFNGDPPYHVRGAKCHERVNSRSRRKREDYHHHGGVHVDNYLRSVKNINSLKHHKKRKKKRKKNDKDRRRMIEYLNGF